VQSAGIAGFVASDHTLRARWKMPCMRTSAFERVLAACVIDPCHASITGGVTDSNAISPKCGSNSERTIDR
jgi:hypothetical protein